MNLSIKKIVLAALFLIFGVIYAFGCSFDNQCSNSFKGYFIIGLLFLVISLLVASGVAPDFFKKHVWWIIFVAMLIVFLYWTLCGAFSHF